MKPEFRRKIKLFCDRCYRFALELAQSAVVFIQPSLHFGGGKTARLRERAAPRPQAVGQNDQQLLLLGGRQVSRG